MIARTQRKPGSGGRRLRGPHTLALGPSLTILEARSCQQSLAQSIARRQAQADGRRLRSIDTAGLQLLLAAGRAARARGLTFKVLGAEALLLEAADSIGLRSALTQVVELTP